MPTNHVRIIGGLWKGRKLRFPANNSLRPTLSRVRETLFNWLAADMAGSHCLDLFAGSGALGFEALSRGAASLTLVDNDRRAVQSLRGHGQKLGVERLLVRQQAASAFLGQAAQQGVLIAGERLRGWDCIFLDPPFASGLLQRTLALLDDDRILPAGGLVYFETRRNALLKLEHWTAVCASTAGATHFGLLQRRRRPKGAEGVNAV